MVIKKLFSIVFSFFCLSTFALNPTVLEEIVSRYESSDSDALRIEVNGQVVLELGDEVPFETMSITKSVVNLAIGILIDQGKIPSVDTPICTYFPEWDVEGKRDVTIRHILSHTSGLKDFSSFEEGYLIPDYIQSSLDAEFMHGVGEGFVYNNRMVNILSGIVEKVSGQRLDLFVEDVLFTPLGIRNYYWNLDFEGHAISMCGLELTARGLSAIGTLILQDGVWEGERIISSEWLTLSFKQSQDYNASCGLLWWLDHEQKGSWPEALLSQYESAGISAKYIALLRSLSETAVAIDDEAMNTLFGGADEYSNFIAEVKNAGLEFTVLQSDHIKGYRADGYLGQYLVIIPKDNVVAVRQIQYGKKPDDQVDEYKDFIELVHKLVK